MKLGKEGVRERLRSTRAKPRHLSDVFTEIAANATGPVSIGAIIDALGDRSFAALLLFFAAINLLPLPPGATLFLGAPMVLLAGQMAWGSRRVWMPRKVRDKAIGADQFRAATAWMAPRLQRLERLIRPRYWPFWRRQGERIVGFIALLLSIIVTLPIPFGNWLPALAIAFLALALSERDGILLAIGTAIGVLSIAVLTLVVGSVTVLFSIVWQHTDWFF